MNAPNKQYDVVPFGSRNKIELMGLVKPKVKDANFLKFMLVLNMNSDVSYEANPKGRICVYVKIC